jgi:hypothetical protein
MPCRRCAVVAGSGTKYLRSQGPLQKTRSNDRLKSERVGAHNHRESPQQDT